MAGVLAKKQSKSADDRSGPTPNHRCSNVNPCVPRSSMSCKIGKELPAKLVKLMAALSNVPKDKFNQGEGYKYLSSDALLDRINPACVKLGLATVVDTELLDWREKTTKSGMIWQIVSVKVTVTIIDSESGEMLQTQGIGGGQDAGDKAFSKAQTAARKYAFMLALNISTGDDPELSGIDPSETGPIQCKHCDGKAIFVSTGDFEGQPINVYLCPKCKKETRVKV